MKLIKVVFSLSFISKSTRGENLLAFILEKLLVRVCLIPLNQWLCFIFGKAQHVDKSLWTSVGKHKSFYMTEDLEWTSKALQSNFLHIYLDTRV